MAPTYAPIRQLLAVIAMASLWGSVIGLRLLWAMIRTGPKKVLGVRRRDSRPAVLDDPELGTHHFARLKNIRLHYVANGQEGRPLILFLHGFPEMWYSWKHQLKEFGNSFRAVAVDMRGYGESDKPRGIAEYHLEKLTEDVKELVEYLGYKKCYLVGHDWGSFVAWATATRFPSVVERLIICNVPNPNVMLTYIWRNYSQLMKSWYMFFFQLPWLPEILLRSNDLAFLKASFRTKSDGMKRALLNDDEFEAFKYVFHKPGDLTGPINYYRAVLRYRLGEEFEQKVQVPTLVIWGTADAFMEKEMAEQSKQFVEADCIVCYVEGASHWVQQDKPDVVNRYITRFVQGKNPSKI